MAIYTKRGDRGRTSLFGPTGEKRWKNDRRVAAIGNIDELNSQLGFVSSFLPGRRKKLKVVIKNIQQDLFEIGAELAAPHSKNPKYLITPEKVRNLEKMIDELEGELPALGNFILPGGSLEAASLHVARSVSRRAEREAVSLSRKEKINPNILAYLNRLSDLLFMLARKINRLEKVQEDLWKGR
ncbi:MAG: cob(I)yrinic acid a,c-diamide adenosyltransferase [Candidatus Blackburnbacteria bacterium]|nr:cob(I)yrinic acid a,c-diamide adenosyltransferase [Candidatus Blackburnbacteria bacterium]